jgi:hypothetical protein
MGSAHIPYGTLCEREESIWTIPIHTECNLELFASLCANGKIPYKICAES